MNKLINRSFSSLKDKTIRIEESKNISFSADVKRFPSYLRVRTHPSLSEYPDKLLVGVFSHELSHLETFIKLSFFRYYILRGFLICFDKYFKKEEKETDITAIKKGYAKALYEQRKLRWNIRDKKIERMKKLYLSPEEIKEIAVNLNKWF